MEDYLSDEEIRDFKGSKTEFAGLAAKLAANAFSHAETFFFHSDRSIESLQALLVEAGTAIYKSFQQIEVHYERQNDEETAPAELGDGSPG